ncbi:MAG: signal peptidase II [Chitinispirillaceae bacterium]|nr:signal peptidase II [Chitinispirillaceae bacterium]
MSNNIKHRWWMLFGVTAAGFALDQWTKALAVRHLSGGTVKQLIGEHLELVLVYNRAAVFGLDPRKIISDFPIDLFFTVATIIAIVVMVLYYRHLKRTEIAMHWGLALVLPGALGNLFDRLLHPGRGVVDFIKADLNVRPFDPWPVFNLADAWVTMGVAVMIGAFVVDEMKRKKAAPQAPPAGAAPHGDQGLSDPPKKTG